MNKFNSKRGSFTVDISLPKDIHIKAVNMEFYCLYNH